MLFQQLRDCGVGSCDMTVKWYQNVEGVEGAVFKDPRRADSKFWGEGKWNTFIKPLLPPERRTFVEIGCSAGLFLKLATDAGFTNVIGIESDWDRFEQAGQYLRANKSTYKVIHQKVDNHFDWNQIPLTDVTLFSNVHYYFPINTFMKLVDHLRSRSLYCIIVSARTRRRSGRTRHYLDAVRGYFRDWEELHVEGDWHGYKSKDVLMAEGDPAPRQQMYSVLFKGVLESVDVEKECAKWEKKWVQGTIELDEYGKYSVAQGWRRYFRRLFTDEDFEYEDTSLYKYWRRGGESHEWILDRLIAKKALANDIRDFGLRDPIYYNQKGHLLDGMHRLSIARELGYKHILARVV